MVESVLLATSPTTTASARLYWPVNRPASLPAVVLSHGYLANSAFLEVPWVAELTDLGCAVLLVDRRGHGLTKGQLFAGSIAEQSTLDELEPELRAAVDYLRTQAPHIDPRRIALLGHSDGATGAIVAASADWGVAATVALSASVAPADYVNHIVPRNLLLLYGDEDHFVLAETDRALIANASRGYLSGVGQVGNLAEGNARRLARIRGRGHLDILYSRPARQAALEWIQTALGATGIVAFSPLRRGWVIAGAMALLVLLATTGPQTAARAAWKPPRKQLILTLILVGLWTCGLWASPAFAREIAWAPAQEGRVVFAVAFAEMLVLIAVGLPLRSFRLPVVVASTGGTQWHLASTARDGVVTAVLVIFACTVLLRHLYEVSFLSSQRIALFAVFAVVSAGLFGALEVWLRRLGNPLDSVVLLCLGAVTGGIGAALFDRMAVLPMYMIAAALTAAAAYRVRRSYRSPLAPVLFGSLLCGWATAGVCALY